MRMFGEVLTAGSFLRRSLLLLLIPAAVSAVFAGLARIGWAMGMFGALAPDHGPLLVIGVFGTIIALERAVAFGSPWAYAGAWCGGLAACAMLAGEPTSLRVFVVGASIAPLLVNGAIVRRSPAAFTRLMFLASAIYALANLAWIAGAAVHAVAPAWMSFFVLTIVAERLELARLTRTPRWAERLLLVLGGMLAPTAIGSVCTDASAVWSRVAGVLFALIASWELRFDLARRTVLTSGLPRYAAIAVLSGAAWLLLAGVVLACCGLAPAGPLYDAALHGVFVGFVLSMVFAHAPIVLPAVARVELPYHRTFYVPFILLHAGLALRMAGDLAGDAGLRRYGGLANALALATFMLVAVASRRRAGQLRRAEVR